MSKSKKVGNQYVNPWPSHQDHPSKFCELFKSDPTPRKDFPSSTTPNWELLAHPDPSQFTLTFVGHSTVLVQIGGLNIVTDPLFGPRCSPYSWVGPSRIHGIVCTVADLPFIDVVLISHNHTDHCDVSAVRDLAAHNLELYARIQKNAAEKNQKPTPTPDEKPEKKDEQKEKESKKAKQGKNNKQQQPHQITPHITPPLPSQPPLPPLFCAPVGNKNWLLKIPHITPDRILESDWWDISEILGRPSSAVAGPDSEISSSSSSASPKDEEKEKKTESNKGGQENNNLVSGLRVKEGSTVNSPPLHPSPCYTEEEMRKMTGDEKKKEEEGGAALPSTKIEKGSNIVCRIAACPSQHFSGMSLLGKDENQSLWASWVVILPGDLQFVFCGDSGYRPSAWDAKPEVVVKLPTCPAWREIFSRFGPMNLALIPVGTYGARTLSSKCMTSEESVLVFKDLHAHRAFGIHHSTFLLTLDPINSPARLVKAKMIEEKLLTEEEAEAAAGAATTKFVITKVGETVSMQSN